MSDPEWSGVRETQAAVTNWADVRDARVLCRRQDQATTGFRAGLVVGLDCA